MALPRKLARPDFEAANKGIWLNPDHLPAGVKAALWALLPRRMTSDQRVHFLSLVGESVQGAAEFRCDVPAAAQSEELGRIEARARGLLKALKMLSSEARVTLEAHAAFLALGTDPPERLTPDAVKVVLDPQHSLVGHWWDSVQDIETATAYAASLITPSKTARPKQTNARRLAFMTARDFYAVAGLLPPASKGAWFPLFVGELGQSVGHAIGPALAASVVHEMQQTGNFPPKPICDPMPARVRAFFKVPGKPPD